MMTRKNRGTFLGIPYDWSKPTLARMARNVWKPGGPMFPPKVWGWGWGLNLAHPGSKWLLGGIAVIAGAAVLLGG